MAGPTRRGKRWVPPKPGMTPSRTSGWPKMALSLATAQSQASASSQPPPRQNPFTSATTGTGSVSRRLMVRSAWLANARASSGVLSRISVISAPATKDFSPAPVINTARRLGCASSSTKYASKALSTSLFSAFKALGRLMVRRTTPSLSTFSITASLMAAP